MLAAWLAHPAAIRASAVAARGDFRGSEWGDSMDEVQRRESARFHHRSEDELAFTDGSIEGIDGGIVYVFERDRLVTGVYVSRESYPNGAGAFEDYEILRRHFEEELGRAPEESRRWIGQPQDGDEESPAAAIAAGRLRVAAEWSLERTHVALLMTHSDDDGVFLRVVFRPSR